MDDHKTWLEWAAERMQERVAREYHSITQTLEGGSLYGCPIDPKNTEHLVVAAFFVGKRDSAAVHRRELDMLAGLRRQR